jgi:hypothetical protein
MKTTNQATESKFDATIEYVRHGLAILTLTDSRGEWSGSGRVERGDKASLYELGYTLACLSAQSKGGRVETYRWIDA